MRAGAWPSPASGWSASEASARTRSGRRCSPPRRTAGSGRSPTGTPRRGSAARRPATPTGSRSSPSRPPTSRWPTAGSTPRRSTPSGPGVHCATGMGGLATFETAVLTRAERGDSRVSPFSVPMIMPNAGAAAVSLRLGWQGPCETVTTACAAGTHGVGNGARAVATGRVRRRARGRVGRLARRHHHRGLHQRRRHEPQRDQPAVRPRPRRVRRRRGRGAAAARAARRRPGAWGPGLRRHRRGGQRGRRLPRHRALAGRPRCARVHAARARRRRASPPTTSPTSTRTAPAPP